MLTKQERAHYYAPEAGMDLERDSRKLIKLLEQDGFERVGAKGSHAKYRKGDRTVIIPHPKKDLPLGTVRSIYRQAGWL